MSRYIDADHLIQKATDIWGDCWDCTCQSTQDFVEYVNAEPTADVKPIVYGEWIDVGLYVYECSNCYNSLEMWWEDKYKFCPNCGARMKGEQTE